jgi:hypothetical protein
MYPIRPTDSSIPRISHFSDAGFHAQVRNDYLTSAHPVSNR